MQAVGASIVRGLRQVPERARMALRSKAAYNNIGAAFRIGFVSDSHQAGITPARRTENAVPTHYVICKL